MPCRRAHRVGPSAWHRRIVRQYTVTCSVARLDPIPVGAAFTRFAGASLHPSPAANPTQAAGRAGKAPLAEGLSAHPPSGVLALIACILAALPSLAQTPARLSRPTSGSTSPPHAPGGSSTAGPGARCASATPPASARSRSEPWL